MYGIILVIAATTCLVHSYPQNTPKPNLNITTTLVPKVIAASPINLKNEEPKVTSEAVPTVKTELKIKCLNDDCNNAPIDDSKTLGRKGVEQNSRKKELDNPSKSKIIDLHKTDEDKNENVHHVKGRIGMDPGVDVVTETNDHVDDLNSLKIETTTSTITTTTTVKKVIPSTKSTTTMSPEPKVEGDDKPISSTSKTSLVVGIVLGCILLSVLIFVGFKRLDAIRRRREYRRMNDFLIDGMYNEM